MRAIRTVELACCMLSEQWDEFEIYKLFEKELQKRKKKGADNGGCGLLRKSSPSTPMREVDLRGTSTADQAMGSMCHA